MSIDDRIACPGDDDLDCHLAGLRLTSVVRAESELTAEAALGFDTSEAGGWWTDQGQRFIPEYVTSLEACFGVMMAPGYEHLAEMQLAILEHWRDEGTYLEMTSAPGKWTMIQDSAGHKAVMPRKTLSAAP